MTKESRLSYMFQLVRSAGFQNIILAFTLIVAIASLAYTHHQATKQRETQYSVHSMEIRPNLKPASKPKINSAMPLLDTDSSAKPIGLYISPLATSIVFENTGNGLAEIVATSSHDFNTTDDSLRKVLLGTNNKLQTSGVKDASFWKQRQITPGNSITLDFSADVGALRDNSFVRHYLIIYKNEAGMLYDTYYWARFNLKEVACRLAKEKHDYNLNVFASNGIETIGGCFALDLIETNVAYHIYTIDESVTVNALLNKYSEAMKDGFETWFATDHPFEFSSTKE